MNENSGTMQEHGQSESARTQRSRRGPRFTLASGAKPLSGYTIKRGVGVGGFGEVYYATSDAGKEVALKRIQRNMEIELRGVRQCLNLKHPNLVALFDIRYDDEDQAWVVMEYVSGESLQDVVERNPNGMPLDLVHKWFGGIAAGVAHLHDCGIVHRDLKPGNIFIDESTVKIGDYGLSKFISCSRRSGQTQSVGTFHYMAPEIGQGRYGKEIDVYALGIMLYEMLTGRVPYDGESSQEIIMKHLTAIPDLSGIDAPYREVIAEALAKDPAARTSSVSEMRNRVIPGAPADGPVVNARHHVGVPIDDVEIVDATSVTHQPIPEEPIAKAFKTAWNDIAAGWKTSELGSTTKLLILLAAIPMLLFNARWLFPYGASILVSYGVYVLIRSMILSGSRKHSASPQASMAAGMAADEAPILAVAVHDSPPRRMRRHARRMRENPVIVERRMLRDALAKKSGRQRTTELVGSMLLAAMVSAIVGLIGYMANGIGDSGTDVASVANFAWMAMTSTVAAWGVLIVSKWWEPSSGDAVRRRFTLLITGLVVGLVAWGLSQFLAIQDLYLVEPIEGLGLEDTPNALYDYHHQPLIWAHLAYFGSLFGLMRWWRQSDPIRSTRLGIWRTAVCLLGALIVQLFFPFPGGFLIPVTTAIAIQIAAPYVDSEERRLICENMKAGVV